ncbi:MAG: MFS transporter [Myxococcales bacterium]|nr:MAG: MFS transporter [Myxococcales bacterium]
MNTVDVILYIGGVGLVCAFVYIIWSYAKGLKGSPRELYILFFTKVVEYSAYGGMNMAFVLYLSADGGLGDIAAGSYIGAWSMIVTLVTILVGAVVDAIGIKRTLLLGTAFLLFARFFMPLLSDVYFVTLLGFIPLAFGIAIMGPVLSVGIKHFTTREGAALGFGLFYTLMNVGWAIGGLIFDGVRRAFGEHQIVSVPGLPLSLSTYQIIFAIGLGLTLPQIVALLLMRDGVRRTETGIVVNPQKLMGEGGIVKASLNVVAKAGRDTVKIFRSVIIEKEFWYFLFMLAILIFVRLTFYHFHYTFPKYGIRLLGEGVKIGNIYGVLNPIMIVFLVPLIASLTKKASSYRMMVVGTFISAFSVFIATIPAEFFAPLMDTWFSELIFDRWLDVPVSQRDPVFFALIFFIACFTVGEAIWSPRLMQFTAEIAPEGKEGSYISLSYLPFFAAKLVAGPLSGWLVATYTPVDEAGKAMASYPHHYMVWVWIGGMAILSPLGLVLFRNLFRAAERKRKAEREEARA